VQRPPSRLTACLSGVVSEVDRTVKLDRTFAGFDFSARVKGTTGGRLEVSLVVDMPACMSNAMTNANPHMLMRSGVFCHVNGEKCQRMEDIKLGVPSCWVLGTGETGPWELSVHACDYDYEVEDSESSDDDVGNW
jgi:hypothetical protein